MDKRSSPLVTHHPVEKFLPCNTHLRDWKHYIIPGLNISHRENDISVEDAAVSYIPPMLNIGRPLPCLSAECVPEQKKIEKDCALQLVRNKYTWKKKKKQFLDLVHKLNVSSAKPRNLIQRMQENGNITKLPYGILRLTNHLVNNPDKHFKGEYNWYYGNTLTTTVMSDEPYLLYAGGEHLNKFCMASFVRKSSSNFIPDIFPKISFSLPDDGLIYDIITSRPQGLIGVRQRDNCTFFTYKDDESITIHECFTVKRNDYPFVSMDIDFQEYCTVDANRHVRFWNPEYQRRFVKQTQLPKCDSFLEDKFVQVKYSSEDSSQIYTVIDRYNVYMFDRRVNKTGPCSLWKPENQVEMCEKISVLIPSIQANHWYIGLTHSCLLLDVRIGFAQRWTHMLSQAPTVGTTFRLNKESHDLKEALLLSTQGTNEVVAIYNQWNGETPVACCSPVSVPNRINTQHEARVNGILTNPLLQNNTIGLSAYKQKKRIGIFSLVSTGDIFHQYAEPNRSTFDKNATRLTEKELTYLENWEQKTISHYLTNKRTLVTTRTADLSELVDYIGEGIEIPLWVTPKPSGKAVWKIAKEDLESYQDVLAPRLLEDFGVDDMDEWASDFEHSNEPDSLGKVQIWLSGNTSVLDATDVEMKDELLLDETTVLTGEEIKETVATDSDESGMSIEVVSPKKSRRRSSVVSAGIS